MHTSKIPQELNEVFIDSYIGKVLTNSKVESPKQGLKSEFRTWSFL